MREKRVGELGQQRDLCYHHQCQGVCYIRPYLKGSDHVSHFPPCTAVLGSLSRIHPFRPALTLSTVWMYAYTSFQRKLWNSYIPRDVRNQKSVKDTECSCQLKGRAKLLYVRIVSATVLAQCRNSRQPIPVSFCCCAMPSWFGGLYQPTRPLQAGGVLLLYRGEGTGQ